MYFVQQRYSDDGDSTLSLLFKVIQMGTDKKLHWFADVLEDEFREEKIAKETRIPAGIYKLAIREQLTPLTEKYRKRYPGWFEFFIEVLNVPNFKYIYLHSGITDDWTDGCLLLALNRTRSNGKQSLVDSPQGMKKFYDEVYQYLKEGKEVIYEIRDENHLLK